MARSEYKTVEIPLQEAIEDVGGACAKFKPTYRGEPDRLCSFPWGYHCLVECKWAGDVKAKGHQARRHEYWRRHGMDVWIAGCVHDIVRIIGHAAIHPTPTSGYRHGVLVEKPAGYVGRRPRTGQDGNCPFCDGCVEATGLRVTRSDFGTETGSGRGLDGGAR